MIRHNNSMGERQRMHTQPAQLPTITGKARGSRSCSKDTRLRNCKCTCCAYQLCDPPPDIKATTVQAHSCIIVGACCKGRHSPPRVPSLRVLRTLVRGLTNTSKQTRHPTLGMTCRGRRTLLSRHYNQYFEKESDALPDLFVLPACHKFDKPWFKAVSPSWRRGAHRQIFCPRT